MKRKYIFGYDISSLDTCLSSDVPLKIGFELLYDCNLFCDYCYLGKIENRTKEYVDIETAKKILNKIKEEGVSSVQFFGGEPTLYPHLLELIKYAKSIDILDVGVLTNGMCDDINLVEQIGLLCDWVHVTLRGTAKTFDGHSNVAGSYDKAFEVMKILNKTKTYIGIEYDCCYDNFDQLEEIVTQLIDIHKIAVKEIWLHRIAPRGLAGMNVRKYLGIDDYVKILEHCRNIESKYNINCKMEDSLPLCLFQSEYHKYILPCKGGFISAYIDPKGNMRRCAASVHSLGNILDSSIKEIWREANIMSEFRSFDWLPASCKQCSKISMCRGGCSVSARKDADHCPDVFSQLFIPFD